MTPEQKELARHALGLPNARKQSYRNHFVTGPGHSDHKRWLEMVAVGEATKRNSSPLTGGDDLFRLTSMGALAAIDSGEQLCPEDFPPGSTRREARPRTPAADAGETRQTMDAYPIDDIEFEDKTIDDVEVHGGTYTIKCNCWCTWCGDESPMVPKAGDTARFYGRGIGSRVRGLFINGTKFFYRTPEEDERKADEDAYGKDAQDWLDRWDTDKGVWSIEMGGLGPGYEQCIQITAAEALRWLLQNKPRWDEKTWAAVADRLQTAMFAIEKVKRLGLSGAQYGAAVNLACRLYEVGPIAVLTDARVKDRTIQVSRTFPQG